MAYWPDTGSGVDTQPARKPVQSAIRKYFTEGGLGQPPTVPGGDWFNQMTNEVLNVLEAAGIEPSKDEDDQLLQAILTVSNSMNAYESLRRSYAREGYNAVGTFKSGFTIVNANDVGIDNTNGRGYTGPVGPVAPGTNPLSGGFIDRSDEISSYFSEWLVPGTDITSEFIAAQNRGRPLRMLSGEYVISAPVEIKAYFESVGGRVVFKANGLPAGSTAVTSNGEHDILGLDVDCSGTPSLQNGFSQNLDFEPTRRLRLDVVARNVTNLDPTQGANGVLLFLASSSPVKKVKLWGRLEGHNVTATANGAIGDSAGAAQGVFSSINGTGVVVDMIWDDPRASKIYPAEDGDGIHTYDGDLSNLDSKSKYVINNPLAWDCAKRGVKIQSPNTVVNDMTVDLDLNDGVSGSVLAFESLGVNTELKSPRVKGKTNLTGDGSILASAANFNMKNPKIEVAAGQNLIRMGPGAENHSVQGGSIRSEKTYASNAFSMVTVEGNASGVIELDSVNVTTRTGSVIRYQGSSSRHNFTVKGLSQAGSLANIAFSTPGADIHIWSYQGDYTGKIIDNTGEDGKHTIHALYGFTSGQTIATCASNVRFTGFGKLQATTNGVLYTGTPPVGAEVSGGWEVRCTAGTGIGIDIGGGAMCRVSGVETIGFDSGIHINANYSGKCVVTDNIQRGLGVGVSTTGSTGLINRDNDQIP